MPTARPLRMQKDGNKIPVLIRWKGFESTENTLEPTGQVFKDISGIVREPLPRKSTLPFLAVFATALLGTEGEL